MPGTPFHIHVLNAHNFVQAQQVATHIGLHNFEQGFRLIVTPYEHPPRVRQALEARVVIVAVDEFTDIDQAVAEVETAYAANEHVLFIMHITARRQLSDKLLADKHVLGVFADYDYQTLQALLKEALSLHEDDDNEVAPEEEVTAKIIIPD